MTDLFDTKDLLTVATADQAKIGTKGYFGDNLSTLIEKVRLGRVEILADVIPDVTYCFQSNNALHHTFFLPADRVEKPYRALESFEELFDFLMPNCNTNFLYDENGKKVDFDQYEKAKLLLGNKITIRQKDGYYSNVMIIQRVDFYGNADNSKDIYINTMSPAYLFECYEILIDGKWVPFGIERQK